MVRVALHSASRLPFPPSSSPTTPLTHTTPPHAPRPMSRPRGAAAAARSGAVPSHLGARAARGAGAREMRRAAAAAGRLCCVVLCCVGSEITLMMMIGRSTNRTRTPVPPLALADRSHRQWRSRADPKAAFPRPQRPRDVVMRRRHGGDSRGRRHRSYTRRARPDGCDLGGRARPRAARAGSRPPVLCCVWLIDRKTIDWDLISDVSNFNPFPSPTLFFLISYLARDGPHIVRTNGGGIGPRFVGRQGQGEAKAAGFHTPSCEMNTASGLRPRRAAASRSGHIRSASARWHRPRATSASVARNDAICFAVWVYDVKKKSVKSCQSQTRMRTKTHKKTRDAPRLGGAVRGRQVS